MCYPTRLLPQQHFKLMSWDDELKKHYLIHFTETKELKDPITNKLKIGLVVRQTDHLRDYSNNLLGVFLVEDIYWAIQKCPNKDILTDEWVEGSKVSEPIVPDEFKKDDSRGYFFMKMEECEDAVIDYLDDPNIKPKCKVLHTPTNSNYWHFSLRWFVNGVDILTWTDKERRRILTSAKSFIIERAHFDEPNYEELDAQFYSN